MSKNAKIIFYPVDNGNMILLKLEDKTTILVDINVRKKASDNDEEDDNDDDDEDEVIIPKRCQGFGKLKKNDFDDLTVITTTKKYIKR